MSNDIGVTLGVKSARWSWKRWLGWLLALVILGGGSFHVMNQMKASAAQPTVHYRTQNARLGDLTITVTATGQLQPTNTVDVGSEVSGIIDQVLVNYNDPVKVGQVLARINTEKLDAQMQQDKASLATSRAKVQDAKVTLEETESEYKRIVAARERSGGQLPSQHDLDTAKAAYGRAKVAVTSTEAAVTQTEAIVAMDQTNLAKAVIKSPVNGVVLARKVEPGQTLAAAFSTPTMFTLAEDLSRMKLQVNIDEADVGQVKTGQKVAFTVDAFPGRRFPGLITQLRFQSTTTNNVVTYLAEISVDNGEMLLRPGMTATAEITVKGLKNALLVPNVALRFTPTVTGPQADNRGWLSKLMPGPPPMPSRTGEGEAEPATPRVYVLRDQQPAAVDVKTGLTNGKVTEIVSGALAAGVPLVVETMKVEP